MTRYTVTWLESALDQLAGIWMESETPGEVNAASARVNELLASDAEKRGAELSEGLRVLQVGRLRVLFEVREDDRIVEVARVVWM